MERNYRGFIIQTVTQDSGRKTYDIRESDGTPWEWALGSLKIAKATIDAELESSHNRF